jgi:hypothetical protein
LNDAFQAGQGASAVREEAFGAAQDGRIADDEPCEGVKAPKGTAEEPF